MTLSSPKRPAIDKRMAPRAALLSGLVLALGLSASHTANATLPSSTNYAIESQAFASSGSRTTSSNYILSGTVGQSSALGAGTSTNYALLPGFQATLDGDGDGYPNHLDAFPSDPAEWVDTDGDTIGNNADTDDDGDGMPDTWENGFVGLDPLVDDAAGDVDSDDYSNLEEYIAGTDPTDPVSRPMQMVDFNYDFDSDILWRNETNGSVNIWQINDFVKAAGAKIGQLSNAWIVERIADFDDDGRADILWRNNSDYKVNIWFMDGFAKVGGGPIGTVGSSWIIAGVGDFDGDGNADILWRKPDGGNTTIWFMDGLTKVGVSAIGNPSADWVIVGVGDFGGDGKADILWRNLVDNRTVVWMMDGGTKTATGSIGTVSQNWVVEGVGDFTGGGQADILWRNISGATVVWEMDGFTKANNASIGTVDPGVWQVARLGDYNGGGQADILWRNPANGATTIWEMNGLVKVAAHPLINLTGWTVQ